VEGSSLVACSLQVYVAGPLFMYWMAMMGRLHPPVKQRDPEVWGGGSFVVSSILKSSESLSGGGLWRESLSFAVWETRESFRKTCWKTL
jgi:hypothetical protein